MNRFVLYASVIVLLVLVGCGSFEVAPVTYDEEAVEPAETVAAAGQVGATATATPEIKPEVAVETDEELVDEAIDDPLPASDELVAIEPPPVTVMPVATADIPTFSQAEAAQWGHAFCPPNIPICLRPYAIESLGNEQLLRVEIWGTGSSYAVASNRVRWSWRADTEQTQNVAGHPCIGSYAAYPSYQEGFGHMSEFCFRMAERPSEIRLEFQAQGMLPVIPFSVGDNLEPVGGWHHLNGSRRLQLDTPFPVGAANVTINSLEEFDDYLLLHVTVQAPSANRLLVNSPEWIVVGHQLRFKSVDATGSRRGWHEGKMRSYEPRLGGQIAAGETAEGYVVLQKAGGQWALLLLYGAPNVTEEDGVMLLPIGGG
jgi:hypothetical protein